MIGGEWSGRVTRLRDQRVEIAMLRITQTCSSKDARDGALGSGMECMEAGHRQLDALLAKPVQHAGESAPCSVVSAGLSPSGARAASVPPP